MGYVREMRPDPVSYYESRGLSLKGPSSSKWKTTRCEFHGGSDSMRVNTTSGAFKCMACDVGGGDVLAYEMRVTGAEFVGATKALGAWVDDGRPPASTKPTTLSPRAALEVLAFETMVVLYGCLPGSKKNLCCVAKKSAAPLYPALSAWFAWFPRLARWPRCISADKRLISWIGLFMSVQPCRFGLPPV